MADPVLDDLVLDDLVFDDLVFDDLPPLGPLYARALAGHVGPRPQSGALPVREAVVASYRQDVSRLAHYDRVCGFTLRDRVPATWLHVVTFPLQVALMAERDFPYGLAGLVHTRNEMTLHRPVLVGDTLTMRVRAERARPHWKGALFDLVGQVRVEDDLAWEGRSTYLARGATASPRAGDRTRAAAEPRLEASALPAPSQRWRLAAGLGREYAAVSGDVNPIHLHVVTARLLGLSRPIAHGMWVHARALAALEGRLPAGYGVDARFIRPIPLPATVGFAAARAEAGIRFGVLGRDGEPHLLGEIRLG